jgi:hypothetical protein
MNLRGLIYVQASTNKQLKGFKITPGAGKSDALSAQSDFLFRDAIGHEKYV